MTSNKEAGVRKTGAACQKNSPKHKQKRCSPGSPESRLRRHRNPAIGIVIGHAGFPRALARAALSIVPARRALFLVSNVNRPLSDLDRELERIAARHPNNPLLVFTDMYGTSCCHAGLRLQNSRPDAKLVPGVNLPMLVRFLQYRNTKTLTQLVRLMRRTAREEARRG